MKYLIVTLVIAALAFAGWKALESRSTTVEEVSAASLFKVKRDTLSITVTENGYLKAKNSLKMKPKFKRQGTINWLIEEGTEVVEGDILVEFDKTDLEDQISELETSLIQYEMEHEAGVAELGIQERDNETVIEKAELALQLAKMGLERYEKGESPNELRKLELAQLKAVSEHERALERYQQVPDLVAEGFMTSIQEEEERIMLKEAETNKDTVTRELELFQTYTDKMSLTEKQTAVKDAQRELDNAHIKSEINIKQKTAAVTQQQRRIDSTNSRLEQLAEEMGHMTMKAPQPGLVHFGDPGRPWMHDQIKVGNSIHQGNTIITLPDLSVMQVLIQVHEADIDMVKTDMLVDVVVETHKGKTFPAKVTDIATVASSQSWDDSTNKTFRVEVTMDPIEVEMRAGTTARTVVRVEEIPDVIQVPIHAVEPKGEDHFCFVYAEGKIEKRQVEVGKNNAHFVEIKSGLAEGERVLLYDPGDSESVGESKDEGEEESTPLAGLGGEE